MLKKLASWLLYKQLKWKKKVTIAFPDKFIICLAPHTSNWDFFFGQLYAKAEGIRSNFLMKKEWFFWPLGMFLRRMGGIPVFRSKHTSMTDRLADYALKTDKFGLCIKANIPILLYGLDYKTKTIECTQSIVPSGDIEADMRTIKLYFKNFKGKHPESFTIGEVDE